MNNTTPRIKLVIAIICTLAYVLIRVPSLIVNETYIGEETIGYKKGLSLSADLLIAIGLLLSLLILYRFQKTS